MSRIHEALKKAEQDRAAAQGGETRPSLATSAAEPPVMAAEEPQVPGAAVPSLLNSFSLEAMQARCQQLEWKPKEKTTLFFNGNDSARGTEEYRTLRSRLYHLRENMPLKKILVTSALPKEGKSFTALNLARVLVRQHGHRVLLIDADLRGPCLHIMLGTTASSGLCDYLQGRGDEFSIMQRGAIENLFFVPSGSQISDPSELVANGRLKFLLQRIEALFDWIIIDSPPALPVSDASMLAKACDGVLMVVRSNVTPVDLARRARLEFPEQSLVGVVLNGTNPEVSPYSRYDYEGYGKSATEPKS